MTKMKKRINVTVYLKRLIEQSGFKKSHISKQLGISPNYLSMILNGQRRPAAMIKKLVEFIESHKSIKQKNNDFKKR